MSCFFEIISISGYFRQPMNLVNIVLAMVYAEVYFEIFCYCLRILLVLFDRSNIALLG